MRQHTISLWDSKELESMVLASCSKQIDIPFQVFDYVHGITGKGTPIIEKIMKNPLDRDTRELLATSVSSKRMFEKPSNILVMGESGKLYPLKVRPSYDAVPLSYYVEYNELHDMYYEHREIAGKFIIIDKRQFNRRGREVLSNL